MNNNVKIALFFGGKISQHLVMIKKAAKKLGVRLDLVSYNRVCFDTDEQRVKIRGNLEGWSQGTTRTIKNEGWLGINEYDVLFFRTTGKHWEEVDLINYQLKIMNYELGKKGPVVVDPIILNGKPSMACKAYQMLALKRAGIDVPKTIYGSLWYLYETMNNRVNSQHKIFPSGQSAMQVEIPEKFTSSNLLNNNSQSKENIDIDFPVILKGSGGDRGTRVYKADNLEELEELVRKLRKSETEEGKRYMLQEFIPNDVDYRVLVLGNKVLGVMKRASQSSEEFRNNYSAGGTVEVADLPENVKKLAIKSAEVCGLAVAGVDVAFRNYDINQPVIWEVNKGPQFKGFMQATGIDVPKEIVKFLVSLKN
jgi:RimK family alpha-L-glutamate ligase